MNLSLKLVIPRTSPRAPPSVGRLAGERLDCENLTHGRFDNGPHERFARCSTGATHAARGTPLEGARDVAQLFLAAFLAGAFLAGAFLAGAFAAAALAGGFLAAGAGFASAFGAAAPFARLIAARCASSKRGVE